MTSSSATRAAWSAGISTGPAIVRPSYAAGSCQASPSSPRAVAIRSRQPSSSREPSADGALSGEVVLAGGVRNATREPADVVERGRRRSSPGRASGRSAGRRGRRARGRRGRWWSVGGQRVPCESDSLGDADSSVASVGLAVDEDGRPAGRLAGRVAGRGSSGRLGWSSRSTPGPRVTTDVGRRVRRGRGGRRRRGSRRRRRVGRQRRQDVEQQRHRGVALGQRPLDEPPPVERALAGLHGGPHAAVRSTSATSTGFQTLLPGSRRSRIIVACGIGSPVMVCSRPVIVTSSSRAAGLPGDGDQRPQPLDVVGRHVAGRADPQLVHRERRAVAAEADRVDARPVTAVRRGEAGHRGRHARAGGDLLAGWSCRTWSRCRRGWSRRRSARRRRA